MITAKQEEKLTERIANLTELELQSLLEEVLPRLSKSQKIHVVESFIHDEAAEERIGDLEDGINLLEEEKEDLENTIDSISKIVYDASDVEEFEDNAFQKLKDALTKIGNLL